MLSKKKEVEKKEGEIDEDVWDILLSADKKDYERICIEHGITDFRGMLKRLQEMKREREEEQAQVHWAICNNYRPVKITWKYCNRRQRNSCIDVMTKMCKHLVVKKHNGSEYICLETKCFWELRISALKRIKITILKESKKGKLMQTHYSQETIISIFNIVPAQPTLLEKKNTKGLWGYHKISFCLISQFIEHLSNLKQIKVKSEECAEFELDMELKDPNSQIFIYKVSICEQNNRCKIWGLKFDLH